MAEVIGCARVTGTVTGTAPAEPQSPVFTERKETLMTARVGQKAPDFTAPAYYKGGFGSSQTFRFCWQVGVIVLLSRRFHLCLSDGSVGGRRQISGTAGAWALKSFRSAWTATLCTRCGTIMS